MSDKRTFTPGRLLSAVFGISRGVILQDWGDSTKPIQVSLQTYSNGAWTFSSQGGVTAYAGLPFSDTIPSGSIVWMVYLYKTYFVLLASCP